MLLLLIRFALADPAQVAVRPFAEAVADLGELELEMPELNIRATHSGRSVWSRVPDGMAVELALTKHGISVDDTSVISVVTTDGNTQLKWVEVSTGEVRLHSEKFGRRGLCTDPVSGGIWRGGRDVKLYSPTPTGEDNVAGAPGFLLVDDDPFVGALVSLAAGDAATEIAVRYEGRLVRESITVSRPSGTVRVERKNGEERICYLPPGGVAP